MKKEFLDLLVVVPLELELKEFLSIFPLIENKTTESNFQGTINLGIPDLKGFVILQDKMGASSAARAMRSVLRNYDIGMVVCLGIAGALTDDLGLLDVCYTGDLIDVGENTRVSDTESGEMLIDFDPTYHSTPKVLTQAVNYSRIVPEVAKLHDDWSYAQHSKAQQLLLEAGLSNDKPSFPTKPPISLNGAIVCGPVVKSEVYKKRLSSMQRKLLAIEMEAGGVFQAAMEHSPALATLVIRGISDLADRNKGQLENSSKGIFRKMAALNAVTFLKLQLSNPYFLENLRAQGISSRADHLAENAENTIVDLASKLADEINLKLRDLSPEYRLQAKGYRLPLPRLVKLSIVNFDLDIENSERLYSLDVIRQGGNLLLILPRTYPDSSLGYVLSDALVVCEFEGRQVFPFVLDGTTIRPPKFGIQNQLSDYDPEKLCQNCLAKVIFIVDLPEMQSKTKREYLSSQIEKFKNAQFVFLVKEDTSDFETTSFSNKHNLFVYTVGEISFAEIAHFVQKNYGLQGNEADVVALRIRDTLRRFRLAVHPTYFAGVAKELLNALLTANRRSELIQLAVDGYLTFLVADDLSDVSLSRSTRERFLLRLAVELRVNKRALSEADTISLAKEFAIEFDFPIDPLKFVFGFVDKGILGFPDGRVQFYLPFMEHYLIADYLRSSPRAAEGYFDIDDESFDYTTFDLYAEMGAHQTIVDKVLLRLKEGIDRLQNQSSDLHILLSNNVRPKLLSRPEMISLTQKRVTEALADITTDTDGRSQKEFLLDMSDQTQERIVEERAKKYEARSKGSLAEVSRIDRHFFIGVVLLGFGAETLAASVKVDLSNQLVKVGSLIVDKWTAANNIPSFDGLREKLIENGLHERIAKSGLSEEDATNLIDDIIGLLEISFLSHPLRRVLEALSEQARSKILATTLSKTKPSSQFEMLIHGIWLSDIDTKEGVKRLKSLFSSMTLPPFLTICVATHLMARVFWRHWNGEDRLRLLDLAADILKSIDQTIDKGKIMRLLEKDKNLNK